MIEPQAQLTAFWRGQTRRFEIALFEGYIHFWEPDSPEFEEAPDEWVWMVEGEIPQRPGLNDASFPIYTNTDFLVSTLRGALDNRRIGRQVTHGGKPIFLGFYGRGTILLRGSAHASFYFDGGEELWTQPESFWHAKIEHWLKEDDDFSFAWNWLLLSENDKARFLTEVCAGDWDELERVCGWILALDGHDWVARNAKPETLAALLTCFNGDYSIRVQNEDEEFCTQRLDVWNEWLRFFNPVFRYDLAQKHIAADSFSRHAFKWHHFLRTTVSSQHEQLELRLLLRDWLRERAGLTNERIALLLR